MPSRYRDPRLFAALTLSTATSAAPVVAATSAGPVVAVPAVAEVAVAVLARPGRRQVHRLPVVDRPEPPSRAGRR